MPMLELSEEFYQKALRQAHTLGFDSVADYLAELVEESTTIPTQPPSFTTKAELDQLLAEALNSPSKEFTDADWQELRRRVVEVHAKQPVQK